MVYAVRLRYSSMPSLHYSKDLFGVYLASAALMSLIFTSKLSVLPASG